MSTCEVESSPQAPLNAVAIEKRQWSHVDVQEFAEQPIPDPQNEAQALEFAYVNALASFGIVLIPRVTLLQLWCCTTSLELCHLPAEVYCRSGQAWSNTTEMFQRLLLRLRPLYFS